jgi:hypothetical protein
MRVTLFPDVHAKTKLEREIDFQQLIDLIRTTKAPSKHDLPLLKLATFGDLRTNKDSLRHDANVLQVYGVECDYDGEQVTFEEASSLAQNANVQVILYTSPSHTPAAPRWRALFPLHNSCLPPARSPLADRANAIFGGVLARETWTLSQAFYYGAVTEHFLLVAFDGPPLDTLSSAQEQPYSRTPTTPAASASNSNVSIEDLPLRIRRAIKSGDPSKFGLPSRSELTYLVACALVREGWTDERGAALLIDPEYPVSAHCRDQGHPEEYARRQMHKARQAIANDWRRSRRGEIIANDQENIRRALATLGARFSYNIFTGRGYINGIGPNRPLDDHEVNELRLSVDREFGFLPNKDFFYDVLDHFTHQSPTHPVLEYLDSLTWDQTPRLGLPWTPEALGTPSWLSVYGGAEDSAYTRAVGRLILIAAVRRLRQPGCKFDEMLVLVDPNQGTDKSSVLRLLARNDDWFTDTMPLGARDKEVIEHLAGRWIVENSELNGIKHQQVEEIKAFLSRQIDRARMAYGRLTLDAPRQCVFFGTTNSEAFLRDIQNRRFWPVKVTGFNLAALAPVVDQLWAEATQAERNNESIRLDPALWGEAADAQWLHRQEEPWATAIHAVLQDMEGKIASHDIWTIVGKPLGQRLQHDNQRLGEAMRELGWRRKHTTAYGRVQWTYVKPTAKGQEPQIYILHDPVNAMRVFASYSPTGDDLATAAYDPDGTEGEFRL